jgi:hypothetical protein
MIIPKVLKVRVRFDKVWNGEDYSKTMLPLAYITYIDEKGKLRKETSWKNWGEKNWVDFTNEPKTGYCFDKTVSRSSEWFGSGRSMFRIVHPNGVQFEISANNLVEIINSCDIIDSEIQTPCVLAWSGTELALIPTNTEIYTEYASVTASLEKGHITRGNMEVGRVYRDKDNKEMVYLGAYHFAGYKQSHKPYRTYKKRSSGGWNTYEREVSVYKAEVQSQKNHIFYSKELLISDDTDLTDRYEINNSTPYYDAEDTETYDISRLTDIENIKNYYEFGRLNNKFSHYSNIETIEVTEKKPSKVRVSEIMELINNNKELYRVTLDGWYNAMDEVVLK